MDWREKWQTAQELASNGKFPAAVDLVKEFAAEPAAMADGKAVLWIFHLALKADDAELTQQMARRLERFPGDEETLTAATWLKSLAVTFFEDGDSPKASEFLTRALVLAPKHREKLVADPRIAPLLKVERDPSTTPMSKDVRRRIRQAADFQEKKDYRKAWETLSPLEAEDSNRIEAVRVGFKSAWHSQWYEMALTLAPHMTAGTLVDRLLAAEFYLSYDLILQQDGRFPDAANVLNEAVKILPEFRETFTRDPRLAGMISSRN